MNYITMKNSVSWKNDNLNSSHVKIKTTEMWNGCCNVKNDALSPFQKTFSVSFFFFFFRRTSVCECAHAPPYHHMNASSLEIGKGKAH